MPIPLKILIATTIILTTSWLSGKRPELAGFLTALPLVSILALAFSYTDHQNLALSAKYARSIIVAVPVSWLFFLPFFVAEKWHLSFWQAWGIGLLFLAVGYFAHQAVMRWVG
jgi:hypothetical protein